ESDARKSLQLVVDSLDQPRLGAIRAAPLRIRLEPDVELDIEEAGRIGTVIGPPQLRGHRGDLRKGAQYLPNPRSDLRGLIERDGVWHGRAHPQRPLIEMR